MPSKPNIDAVAARGALRDAPRVTGRRTSRRRAAEGRHRGTRRPRHVEEPGENGAAVLPCPDESHLDLQRLALERTVHATGRVDAADRSGDERDSHPLATSPATLWTRAASCTVRGAKPPRRHRSRTTSRRPLPTGPRRREGPGEGPRRPRRGRSPAPTCPARPSPLSWRPGRCRRAGRGVPAVRGPANPTPRRPPGSSGAAAVPPFSPSLGAPRRPGHIRISSESRG